jgi:hypothetical protein
VAIHHETHNGWGTDQTAGRLKQLCRDLAAYLKTGEFHGKHLAEKDRRFSITPEQIPVKVDVDGLGAGVVDQRDMFNFTAVSGTAPAGLEYRNRRSALWFNTVDLAKEGAVALGRLEPQALALLRQQAMSPTYKVDNQGRLEVEPKADTKERLKRSPDDMDALNLAFFIPQSFEAPPILPEERENRPSPYEWQPREGSRARDLFSRDRKRRDEWQDEE